MSLSVIGIENIQNFSNGLNLTRHSLLYILQNIKLNNPKESFRIENNN